MFWDARVRTSLTYFLTQCIACKVTVVFLRLKSGRHRIHILVHLLLNSRVLGRGFNKCVSFPPEGRGAGPQQSNHKIRLTWYHQLASIWFATPC